MRRPHYAPRFAPRIAARVVVNIAPADTHSPTRHIHHLAPHFSTHYSRAMDDNIVAASALCIYSIANYLNVLNNGLLKRRRRPRQRRWWVTSIHRNRTRQVLLKFTLMIKIIAILVRHIMLRTHCF